MPLNNWWHPITFGRDSRLEAVIRGHNSIIIHPFIHSFIHLFVRSFRIKCVNSAVSISCNTIFCFNPSFSEINISCSLRILLAYLTFEWEKSFSVFHRKRQIPPQSNHFEMSPESHAWLPLRRNYFSEQLLVTQRRSRQYLFFDMAIEDQSDGRYSWRSTSDKDRITSFMARPFSGNPWSLFKAWSLNFFQ